jgi:RTX calcium-binding nonapeptide repeat (4 copies)
MAVFRISSSLAVGTLPSVLTVNDFAFDGGTAAADTLTIDPDAFLITNASVQGFAAVLLDTAGAWTVNVNGYVGVVGAGNSDAFDVRSAGTKITIGTTGSVVGQFSAFNVSASNFSLTNNGDVFGQIVLSGTGIHTIVNTGEMLFSGLTNTALAVERFTNSGDFEGRVSLGGGADTVTNSGTLIGASMGADNDIVTNSGLIKLEVDLGGGILDQLTNSGTIGQFSILHRSYVGGSGSDRVTNSGTLAGSVVLGEGNNSVLNKETGTIIGETATVFVDGAIVGGGGNDTITNQGIILGKIQLGDGTNLLTNSGTLTTNGIISYSGGNGSDRITNSGTMGTAGSLILLGDGSNFVTNSGTMLGNLGLGSGTDVVNNTGNINSLLLGDGTNTVTSAGHINAITGGTGVDRITIQAGGTVGTLLTGIGNDVVTIAGKVNSNILLGAGTDTLTGGDFTEAVIDEAGSDIYNLNGGNDRYFASSLNAVDDVQDKLDGGAGTDEYIASGIRGLHINLDTVNQFHFSITGIILLANTAVETGGGKDSVLNFENVLGGQKEDIILGSGAANILEGWFGDDFLSGGAGADTLFGGDGLDRLVGGAGKDLLTGDAGADRFILTAIIDSGPSAATRDTITDFTFGTDLIDLRAIDASTTVAGDQSFVFIGTNVNWSHSASELRVIWTALGQIIEGDTNGNGVADFSILIQDGGSHTEFSGIDNINFLF